MQRASFCDGASRHMPKARNREVLQKGSYEQAAMEST